MAIEITWLTGICLAASIIGLVGAAAAYAIWMAMAAGEKAIERKVQQAIVDAASIPVSVIDLSRIRTMASEDGHVYLLLFDPDGCMLFRSAPKSTPVLVSLTDASIPSRVVIWARVLVANYMIPRTWMKATENRGSTKESPNS